MANQATPPFEAPLHFIKEIDKLKGIERKTLTFHLSRPENSAEHSWHLAMSVLALAPVFHPTDFDLLKALKMALLHDVVEIDAGDTFIYADQSKKADEEEKAAERIFGLLPRPSGEELRATWREFEAKQGKEAKFVAALDRMLPIYTNHMNQGYSWRQNGVKLHQVIERNGPPIQAASPELWAWVESLLEKSVAAGHLQK